MQATGTRRTVACLLWLAAIPAALPAQVLEVGDDGIVRAAPGITSGSRTTAADGARSEPPVPAAPPRHAAGPAAETDWIVQLGAYESTALLDAAWQQMLRRHGATLKGLRIVRSEAIVAGRRYFRLAAAGFEDLPAASALCRTLRREGGACYVRADGP